MQQLFEYTPSRKAEAGWISSVKVLQYGFSLGKKKKKKKEEQYNLQKEHHKNKFKYFQAWEQFFVLLSTVVQLQLKSSLFLKVLCGRLKWKRTNKQPPVYHGGIGKIFGANIDASLCAYSLGEVSGVLTWCWPPWHVSTCKQYCNRSKSHPAQMEPWSDLYSSELETRMPQAAAISQWMSTEHGARQLHSSDF